MIRRNAGFTLIELLVVIAIIAILAAILFPVFISAKAKAQQTQCMSNMNQIGKATFMYTDDWSGCTPFAYNAANWDLWDQGTWRERLASKYLKSRKVLICPVPTKASPYAAKYPAIARSIGHYGMNYYVVMAGSDGGQNGYRKLSTIPMPSKTILFSENKDGDWSAEPWNNESTGSNGEFWPYHGDKSSMGGIFTFCDGHAQFMSVSRTESNDFFFWKVVKNK